MALRNPIAQEAARPLPWHTAVPLFVPSLVAVASLTALLLLVQMGGVTVTGYDIRRLEEIRSDWEHNNYLLEAYIADLQSLDRIEHLARERLRMVKATQHIFLTVPTSPTKRWIPEEMPPSHVKRAATAGSARD